MASCTFFGHRDCPSSIRGVLTAEIEQLISHHQVSTFYVGTHGNFDRMVYSSQSLLTLSTEYGLSGQDRILVLAKEVKDA